MEEAVAMQMARAAEMPVRRVLCCGEHPNDPDNRVFSILMTRLPGEPLENTRYPLEIESEGPWLEELVLCVHSMRLWCPPKQKYTICSPIGTSIQSSRVPGHVMGPSRNEKEFHEYLLGPASGHAFEAMPEYDQTLSCKDITAMPLPPYVHPWGFQSP